MKKILILLFISFLTTACQQNVEKYNSESLGVNKTPTTPEMLPHVYDGTIKNVIFLIGDGTGIAQITSGQYAIAGLQGRLHIQTMPVTGIVQTFSSDNLITDSAAGGTAMACGTKTYNGAIGVIPDGTPCNTILELAEEKGLSTGLISTSSITHATPASFAAHVEQRSMQEDIAVDFLDSGVEVFLGGGVKWFSAEHRSDSLDLISQFKDAGYQYLRNEDELSKASGDRLLGLFAEDGMERNEDEPSSALMTEKALDLLSKNEDGFFIMIEGSQIDWAGHANDSEYLVREMKDFDAAVKTALDFAKENGETLVILTADHETGGMTLQKEVAEGDSVEVFWTSGSHTGTPVPLFAYGPGSLEFTGWRDNTEIPNIIKELLEL
jgi:alkaline phosphatase